MEKNKKLEKIRHSCSHLLASAVEKLFPDSKRTIGPAIEKGFYYDFDFSAQGGSASGGVNFKITEADLPKIEEKMQKILKTWKNFQKSEMTIYEAKQFLKDNPYKLELLKQFAKEGQKKVSFYKSGDFIDLCEGNHTLNPQKDIRSFKLTHIAGAYWRGSEKNKMLTRIYGTCFPTQKELEEYLKAQEEAKESDHRIIGKKLDLFVFSDLVGKGLPLFTEKGSVIRRELERFIVDEEIKRGYFHVYTPDLAKVDLYKKSGHYPYYKETMYPVMKVDEEELILRPMTCPHHFELYASKLRSYRELPIRFAELAKQFRYEKSGELTGLSRVRLFCLADAHIIARRDQAEEEINKVLDLIEYAANVLGLKKKKDYRYQLSQGDRNNNKKYYQDEKAWDFAENVLRKVLNKRKSPYYEAKGEAAFYGPKIDIQMKNNLGKEETAFTVQYDFVMPKRFALKYIDSDGKEKEPVVIHRSSIGALERVMAFLIEHYKGAFPVWLAPVQIILIPISEKHRPYAQKIEKRLKENNIRVEIDNRNQRMQAKIRDATLQKIPYLCIIGDKEINAGVISIRKRQQQEQTLFRIDDFIKELQKVISSKR